MSIAVLLAFSLVGLSGLARATCPVDPYGCLFDEIMLENMIPGDGLLHWPFCSVIKVAILVPPGFPADAATQIGAGFEAWDGLSTWFSIEPATSPNDIDGNVSYVSTGPWQGLQNAFAHTRRAVSADETKVVGFDMEFNLVTYPADQWTSTCTTGKVHILTIVVHETGHALGFAHIDGNGSGGCPTVMKPWNRDCPCRATTDSWDAEAVRHAYDDQAGTTAPCKSNPAADVADFMYRDGSVQWTVDHEWETAQYVIEGCDVPDGAGVELAVEPPKLGQHSVSMSPQGFKWLRLTEVETSGRRNCKAVCLATESLPRAVTSPVDDGIVRRREEIAGEVAALDAAPSFMVQAVEHPTCVVYAMPTLVNVIQSQFANYWNGKGHAVQVVSVPLHPDAAAARVWLKSSIQGYAESEGVRYFLLAGDWEDDFASPLWHSTAFWDTMYVQDRRSGKIPTTPPNNDYRIPTFLIPDAEGESENTARWRPYIYSDRPYADIDDNGRPDVVVARWPFSDATSVAVACENMQYYADDVWFFGARDAVSFLVGDLASDAGGNVVRAQAGELIDLVGTIAPEATIDAIYETDFPSDQWRNDVTAIRLNSTRPRLVSILGNTSKQNRPGNFFVRQDPLNTWDMSSLYAGYVMGSVVAASCEAALWIPFGSTFNDWVVYRDFLTTPDRGTISWIGPTTGSYQNGDYLVTHLLIEELYANPYRPMAESWLTAMQRAYAEASPELTPTLDAFVFLGNPLSTFMRTPRHRSEAFVQKKDEIFRSPMPDNFAVGCPQGDLDKLILRVFVNAADVSLPVAAEDISVSQPTSPDAAIFSDQSVIHADAMPTFVSLDPVLGSAYRWEVTISAFSGCGEHLVPVSFRGMPLDYARVNIRSPNLVLVPATGPSETRTKVSLVDFSDLTNGFPTHYPSSICNCAYPKTYSPCMDYVFPDTAVTMPDFAKFGEHFGHGFTSGGASPSTSGLAMSIGVARLEFEEEQPLVGPHLVRARVVLDGVEPFTAAVVALASENPLFRYVSWTPDPSFDGAAIGTELTRDEVKQVFLGVVRATYSSASTTILGTAEFVVESADPVQLTPQDFELITGELLSAAGGEGVSETSGKQQVLSLLAREITLTPPTYRNELAQSYPNPFNPTTTLAFSLAKGTDVDLRIFDVRGALVKTLVHERREPGVHRVRWDGYNQQGNRVASGVYFYKLVAGSFVDTKKMTLLK